MADVQWNRVGDNLYAATEDGEIVGRIEVSGGVWACSPTRKYAGGYLSESQGKKAVEEKLTDDGYTIVQKRLGGASLGQTMGWQPIETAPKDGAWILLYEPRDHECAAYDPACNVAKWHTWDSYGETTSGWYVSDNNCHEFTTTVDAPTHWMPLPAPPSDKR